MLEPGFKSTSLTIGAIMTKDPLVTANTTPPPGVAKGSQCCLKAGIMELKPTISLTEDPY
jgi:hypothetical protein